MFNQKNIIKPTKDQVREISKEHSTLTPIGLVDADGNSIVKSEEPGGTTYSTLKDLGADRSEGDLVSLVTQDPILELSRVDAVQPGFLSRLGSYPTLSRIGLAATYLFAALGGAYLAAHAPPAAASDLDIGCRGPGPIQLDSRFVYSINDLDVTSQTGILMPKFFTGNDVGVWGQAIIPYKSIDTLTGSNEGLGDISIMVGPRGKIAIGPDGKYGELNFRAYGGIVLPTGDEKALVPLGNGRQDILFGVMLTQYFLEKRAQISATVEHASTGINHLDVNPPDFWSYGVTGGVKLNDKLSFGAGIAGTENEVGDRNLNSSLMLKYVLSKQLQFEIMHNSGIESRNMPMANTTVGIMRYNFGVK